MTPQGQAGSMLATSKKEGPVYEGRPNHKQDREIIAAGEKKGLLRQLLGKMVKSCN